MTQVMISAITIHVQSGTVPTDARRDAAFTGVQPQARNDVRKRKPIGFWLLCCVRFIEVFLLGSQTASTRPAVRKPRRLRWPVGCHRSALLVSVTREICQRWPSIRKVKSLGSVAVPIKSLKWFRSPLQRYTTNTNRSFQDLILPLSIFPTPSRYSTHFPTCSGPQNL
jgi:hypothetical protein